VINNSSFFNIQIEFGRIGSRERDGGVSEKRSVSSSLHSSKISFRDSFIDLLSFTDFFLILIHEMG